MADDPTPASGGVDTFLDRIQDELNDASGANDLADQRDNNTAGAPTNTPEPGAQTPSPDDLNDIKPTGDTDPNPGAPDPLDDLSDAANKGTTPTADPKPDDGGGDNGGQNDSHTDVLASFDPDDQAKIRAYIDEQVASEVTATESAGGAFKRLKAQNRELEGKVRELETRTSDPEALNAATERISELEGTIKTMEEKNSAIRLEDTQAYQDAVTKPQQDILAASDTIADRYGADKDALANLLGNPDRRVLSDKINQLLGDDVAEADKFELYELSRKAEDTFAKKRELTENATAALEEAEALATKAQERQALEARQARSQAAQETVDRVKAKAPFILEAMGDEAVAAFADRAAETPVEALSPADQAFAKLAFDALIPVAKRVMALEAELQTANDDIVKLRGATPGSTGAGTATPKEGDADPAPGKSEGIGSAVGRIGDALAAVS